MIQDFLVYYLGKELSYILTAPLVVFIIILVIGFTSEFFDKRSTNAK
jgi:hypothetical protein